MAGRKQFSDALPDGGATSALQTAIETLVTASNALLDTIDADTGSIKTATETLAGAVDGTEVQTGIVGSDIKVPVDIGACETKSARNWGTDGNAGGSLTLDTQGFKSVQFKGEVCDSNGRPVETNPGGGATDWTVEISDNNSDWWTVATSANVNFYELGFAASSDKSFRYYRVSWTASGQATDLIYVVISAKP